MHIVLKSALLFLIGIPCYGWAMILQDSPDEQMALLKNAIEQKDLNIVLNTITNNPSLISFKGQYESSLLHEAVRLVSRDNESIVKQIICYLAKADGFDMNTKDDQGATALTYSAMISQVSPGLVKHLLDNGADPNIANNQLNTPLHCTSGHVNFEKTQVLLGYGANVDAKDSNGHTPMHLLISAIIKSSTAEKITDEGVVVNKPNREGLPGIQMLNVLIRKSTQSSPKELVDYIETLRQEYSDRKTGLVSALVKKELNDVKLAVRNVFKNRLKYNKPLHLISQPEINDGDEFYDAEDDFNDECEENFYDLDDDETDNPQPSDNESKKNFHDFDKIEDAKPIKRPNQDHRMKDNKSDLDSVSILPTYITTKTVSITLAMAILASWGLHRSYRYYKKKTNNANSTKSTHDSDLIDLNAKITHS